MGLGLLGNGWLPDNCLFVGWLVVVGWLVIVGWLIGWLVGSGWQLCAVVGNCWWVCLFVVGLVMVAWPVGHLLVANAWQLLVIGGGGLVGWLICW